MNFMISGTRDNAKEVCAVDSTWEFLVKIWIPSPDSLAGSSVMGCDVCVA